MTDWALLFHINPAKRRGNLLTQKSRHRILSGRAASFFSLDWFFPGMFPPALNQIR
jgi:hypothetical protein